MQTKQFRKVLSFLILLPQLVNMLSKRQYYQKDLQIPESVVSINDSAFSQIDQLPKNFALPSNLTEISESLF
jgi:hypothetical protein